MSGWQHLPWDYFRLARDLGTITEGRMNSCTHTEGAALTNGDSSARFRH
jgi:hypothetical protein